MGHRNFVSFLKDGRKQWQEKKCNNVRFFGGILQYLGYWPTSNPEQNHPSKFNYFLSRYIFICSFIIAFLVLPTNLFVLHGTDIFAVCETVVTLFLAGMVLVHSGCFLFQPNRFDQMMTAYEDLEELSIFHLSHPDHVKLMGRQRDTFILCYYYFFTVGLFPGIAFGLPVYCALTREFFIRVWYPWDFKASPQFELTIAAWMTPFVVGCHLCVLVYVFLMSLFVEVVRHFQLLRHNLRHVVRLVEEVGELKTITTGQGGKARQCKGLTLSPCGDDQHPEDEGELLANRSPSNVKLIIVEEFLRAPGRSEKSSLLPDEGLSYAKRMIRRKTLKKQRFEKKLRKALENCIRHQVAINRFLEKINIAYDAIIIHQFNSSVCPMIAAIVLITNTVGYDPRAALLLMTILGCLCPTAIFCWLADKVAEESEGVREALFDCDWLRAPESFKRSMRIMMSRSNQPVEFRVARFVTLSLETFSKLIKLTFNSYMSLRTALERSHQDKEPSIT